jgi:hypothetical protein
MHDNIAIERMASDLLQARDTAGATRLPSQYEAGFDLHRGYQVGNDKRNGIADRRKKTPSVEVLVCHWKMKNPKA